MIARPLTLIQGELFDIPPGGPASGRAGPALGAGDPLPAGPFVLGMTFNLEVKSYEVPFTVRSPDGQTVAGHIPSIEIAKAIRDALNTAHPVAQPQAPMEPTCTSA